MAKLATAIVVLGLVGSVHLQNAPQPVPQGGPLGGLNNLLGGGQGGSGGPLGGLTNLLGGGQNGGQNGGGPLGGLTNILGGGQNGAQGGGGPLNGLTSILGGGQNGGQNGGGPLGGLTNLLGGGQNGGQNGGGPLGGLSNILNGGQNGQPGSDPIGGLTNLLGQDGTTNLMNGLLGTPQQQQQMQQNQGAGGLTDLLRRLPQRGIELLQGILSQVRTMLPGGMGRNGQPLNRNPMDTMNGGNQQAPNMPNMPNPFAAPMNDQQNNPLGQLSSNLNGLTRPVTNLLSNGQLPDVNEVTNQLSQTANQLGQGLTRTLSGAGNSNANSNANGQANGATTPTQML